MPHRNQSPPAFLVYMKRSVALLVSLTIHLVLLLILTCWFVASARTPSQFVLLGGDGEPDVDAVELALDSGASSGVNISQAMDVADRQSSMVVDLERVELEQVDSIASELESTSAFSASVLTAAGSSQDGIGGLGDGYGRSSGASFFGASASGNRFVYILDSSSSMDGPRWNLARAKLLQSLRELGPKQQFFVICFDEKTTLLFDRSPNQIEYQSPDTKTIQRVQRWLRSRALGPSTMPAEALMFALQMQPDAIFLLSDGELADDSVSIMRQWNVNRENFRRVPIHTVHLISPQGRYKLQQIAQENDGTLTVVADQSTGRGSRRAR